MIQVTVGTAVSVGLILALWLVAAVVAMAIGLRRMAAARAVMATASGYADLIAAAPFARRT